MKKTWLPGILVCMAMTLGAADELQICKFPDGKKAMLALTFDDILADQVRYAPAILEKYGFKATFFMIPDRLGHKGRAHYANLEDIPALVEAGHEIGNHSMNHSSIPALLERENHDELERVVNGSQQKILELTGVKPQSFCYPGNRRSEQTDQWILNSHLVLTTRNRKLRKTPDEVKTQLQSMVKRGTFGDTMIHGIIEGYDPYKSVEDFEGCIAMLKEFENDIAIGTMLETGSYAARAAAAKLTLREESPEKTVYLLELAPESGRYAGELSLRLPNAANYTVITGDALTTPVNGVFKARTGDRIQISRRSASGSGMISDGACK